MERRIIVSGRRSRVFLAACLVSALAFASSASAQLVRWGSYYGGGPYMNETPTSVPGLENVTQIDAGNADSYVLEADGTEWSWGNGEFGGLGDGNKADTQTPKQVLFPADVKIVSIGEARDNGYAIDSTGQGWAWGLGEEGSTCRSGKGGIAKKHHTPFKVSGITDAVAVQGGQNHVLWLLADGTVKVCGTNDAGQLGVGPETEMTSVPMTVSGLENVVEVTAGVLSSAARTADGTVYTWGENIAGQAGVGALQPIVYEPEPVTLPGPASEISCGGDSNGGDASGFDLALVEGQVYGWGNDKAGQIGDHSNTIKFTPVATGLHYTQVIASGEYSVGLSAAGAVFTWGSPKAGELGTGGERKQAVPVQVDSGVTMISATAKNALAG